MRLTLLSLVVTTSLFVTTPARAQSDSTFGRDKAVHFAVGLGISALSYGVAAEVLESPVLRAVVGGSVALAAGIGKELLDLAGLGEPEWLDIAFDLLGIATGLLVAWAIDALVRARRSGGLAGALSRPSG